LRALVEKIKEVLFAVVPITVLVLVLSFTLTPLEPHLIIRFSIGAVVLMAGLTLFLMGVNIGITSIGNHMGAALAKRNSLLILIVAGLALGFFISIAEPDLHILAQQVDEVTKGLLPKFALVVVVSVGVAVMLALGMVRIVYNAPINIFLTVAYIIIFVLAIFNPPEILAIAFDASGATTGALTVPFILALAVGVSSMKKDSRASEEDSFGLLGIVSAGAIMGPMVMNLFTRSQFTAGEMAADTVVSQSIFTPFLQNFPDVSADVAIALSPMLLIFIFFQIVYFRLPAKQFIRTVVGMGITYFGLVLFLVGVNAGFMDAAREIGKKMAMFENRFIVIGLGFLIGLVTILAEPAVHVLTDQVEDVTSGYVKKRLVLFTLCLGVGASVALSLLRILIPGLQLWHFLLPGYIISIIMTFFAPKLFVGVAFDSGGVASGPMTATFILAFSQGVAAATPGADVLADGFGIIAMVAMTPVLALQILGLLFLLKTKTKKGGAEKNG